MSTPVSSPRQRATLVTGSLLLAAIAALLHLLLIDPWVWLLLRVLYGLALVTLYMVIESWLNAQAPNEKRGQVFAVYMAVNLGALALAQHGVLVRGGPVLCISNENTLARCALLVRPAAA